METTIVVDRTRPRVIYLISIIPFILNDFSSVYASPYSQWVLVDYACRLAVLGFVAVMVGRRSLAPGDLFLSFKGKGALAYWALLLAAMSYGYHLASGPWLAPLDGVWSVSTVAYDRGAALFALDMTLGLGLVAVSEEIVFRGLALSALKTFTRNPVVILLASSLVFALIHWSTGLGNILDSFAYGLLFMAVTLRTGSIVPATVIHYNLDFYLLART